MKLLDLNVETKKYLYKYILTLAINKKDAPNNLAGNNFNFYFGDQTNENRRKIIDDLIEFNLIDRSSNTIDKDVLLEFGDIDNLVEVNTKTVLNSSYESIFDFYDSTHNRYLPEGVAIDERAFTSKAITFLDTNSKEKYKLSAVKSDNDQLINQLEIYSISELTLTIDKDNNETHSKIYNAIFKDCDQKKFAPDVILTTKIFGFPLSNYCVEYKFNKWRNDNLRKVSKFKDFIKCIIYLLKYPNIDGAMIIFTELLDDSLENKENRTRLFQTINNIEQKQISIDESIEKINNQLIKRQDATAQDANVIFGQNGYENQIILLRNIRQKSGDNEVTNEYDIESAEVKERLISIFYGIIDDYYQKLLNINAIVKDINDLQFNHYLKIALSENPLLNKIENKIQAVRNANEALNYIITDDSILVSKEITVFEKLENELKKLPKGNEAIYSSSLIRINVFLILCDIVKGRTIESKELFSDFLKQNDDNNMDKVKSYKQAFKVIEEFYRNNKDDVLCLVKYWFNEWRNKPDIKQNIKEAYYDSINVSNKKVRILIAIEKLKICQFLKVNEDNQELISEFKEVPHFWKYSEIKNINHKFYNIIDKSIYSEKNINKKDIDLSREKLEKKLNSIYKFIDGNWMKINIEKWTDSDNKQYIPTRSEYLEVNEQIIKHIKELNDLLPQLSTYVFTKRNKKS